MGHHRRQSRSIVRSKSKIIIGKSQSSSILIGRPIIIRPAATGHRFIVGPSSFVPKTTQQPKAITIAINLKAQSKYFFSFAVNQLWSTAMAVISSRRWRCSENFAAAMQPLRCAK